MNTGEPPPHDREIIRIGSAAMDNVPSKVIQYIPNIACKRAVVKCIVDCLNLEDVIEDFYEPLEQEDGVRPDTKDKLPKKKITKITQSQLLMIKQLSKKFDKRKYVKMTEEDAEKEINKLKKKVKK
jgi:hypothetical protein